jgi:hypothetical protein
MIRRRRRSPKRRGRWFGCYHLQAIWRVRSLAIVFSAPSTSLRRRMHKDILYEKMGQHIMSPILLNPNVVIVKQIVVTFELGGAQLVWLGITTVCAREMWTLFHSVALFDELHQNVLHMHHVLVQVMVIETGVVHRIVGEHRSQIVDYAPVPMPLVCGFVVLPLQCLEPSLFFYEATACLRVGTRKLDAHVCLLLVVVVALLGYLLPTMNTEEVEL